MSAPLQAPAAEEAAPRRASGRRAAWIFLTAQCFYLLWASGRPHTVDEYEACFVAEALAERGETTLPPEKAFFGRRDLEGRFHSPYGPLLPLVAAPGCAAGRALSGALGLEPRAEETLGWLATTAVNTTVAAAGVALFFLLLRALGAGLRPALGTSAALALATPWWHYATTFFSEPLTGTLLLASLLLLARQRAARGAFGRLWPLLVAGLPLGAMAANRLATAVLFPLPVLWVLWASEGSFRRKLAAASAFALPAAVAVAGYLAWNLARFGDPLQLGYPPVTEGALDPAGFGESLPRGLYGLLLSPGKGLVWFAPVVVLGLLASRRLVRRASSFGALLLLLPLVVLLFHAKYSHWEGGYCWGPRYLLPTLPLWIAPLAFARARGRLGWRAVTAVVAVSILWQALGVSVSFLECQVDRGYYSGGFVYDLGYSAPAATWEVAALHVREAVGTGSLLAGTEGLGFDRWFLTLYRSGFSALPLALVALALLGGALAGLQRLHRLALVEHRERTPRSRPKNRECEVVRGA